MRMGVTHTAGKKSERKIWLVGIQVGKYIQGWIY